MKAAFYSGFFCCYNFFYLPLVFGPVGEVGLPTGLLGFSAFTEEATTLADVLAVAFAAVFVAVFVAVFAVFFTIVFAVVLLIFCICSLCYI
jgi:hypothetical protein